MDDNSDTDDKGKLNEKSISNYYLRRCGKPIRSCLYSLLYTLANAQSLDIKQFHRNSSSHHRLRWTRSSIGPFFQQFELITCRCTIQLKAAKEKQNKTKYCHIEYASRTTLVSSRASPTHAHTNCLCFSTAVFRYKYFRLLLFTLFRAPKQNKLCSAVIFFSFFVRFGLFIEAMTVQLRVGATTRPFVVRHIKSLYVVDGFYLFILRIV